MKKQNMTSSLLLKKYCTSKNQDKNSAYKSTNINCLVDKTVDLSAIFCLSVLEKTISSHIYLSKY